MWEGGRAGACPGCGPACKRAELSSDRAGLPETGGSGRGGAALLDGDEDGEEASGRYGAWEPPASGEGTQAFGEAAYFLRSRGRGARS